jgi:hypothetical protein
MHLEPRFSSLATTVVAVAVIIISVVTKVDKINFLDGKRVNKVYVSGK